MNLSKTFLKQLAENPPAQETLYPDNEIRGLALRWRPGASPSWLFRYRRGGPQQRIHIGLATDISPDDARKIARGFRAALADGKDPKAMRARAKAALTMKEFADLYQKDHALLNKKPRPAAEDRRLWDRYILPRIGTRGVDSITKEDVLKLKAEAARAAKGRANGIIALLSKAFGLAEDWGYRPQNTNPCHRVEKYDLGARERILTAEELARFGQALERLTIERPRMAKLFEALILTGARLRELMHAKLADLNVDRMVFILPDSKTGSDELQLSTEAMAVLLSVERPKGCEWLFPGDIPGQPIINPYRSWKALLKEAGISDCRVHDLRHAFGSYSHRSGASQKTVSKLLRHASMATSERYIKGFDKDRQDAASATAKTIAGLMRPKLSDA